MRLCVCVCVRACEEHRIRSCRSTYIYCSSRLCCDDSEKTASTCIIYKYNTGETERSRSRASAALPNFFFYSYYYRLVRLTNIAVLWFTLYNIIYNNNGVESESRDRCEVAVARTANLANGSIRSCLRDEMCTASDKRSHLHSDEWFFWVAL